MIWIALYLAFGTGCFFGCLAVYTAFIRGEFEDGWEDMK